MRSIKREVLRAEVQVMEFDKGEPLQLPAISVLVDKKEAERKDGRLLKKLKKAVDTVYPGKNTVISNYTITVEVRKLTFEQFMQHSEVVSGDSEEEEDANE